jgi:hypothetical protein
LQRDIDLGSLLEVLLPADSSSERRDAMSATLGENQANAGQA